MVTGNKRRDEEISSVGRKEGEEECGSGRRKRQA